MIYSWWEGFKKRGGMSRSNTHVINFTPESGFIIEKLAQMVVKAMQEMNMDAHINLPGKVILEVEKECTEQEIIDGYNDFMSGQVKMRTASNKNEKETH